MNVLPRSRQGREEVQASDDQGMPWPSAEQVQHAGGERALQDEER